MPAVARFNGFYRIIVYLDNCQLLFNEYFSIQDNFWYLPANTVEVACHEIRRVCEEIVSYGAVRVSRQSTPILRRAPE